MENTHEKEILDGTVAPAITTRVYIVDYVERDRDGMRGFGFHTPEGNAGYSSIEEDWVYELVLAAFTSNKKLVVSYDGAESPQNILKVRVEN